MKQSSAHRFWLSQRARDWKPAAQQVSEQVTPLAQVLVAKTGGVANEPRAQFGYEPSVHSPGAEHPEENRIQTKESVRMQIACGGVTSRASGSLER